MANSVLESIQQPAGKLGTDALLNSHSKQLCHRLALVQEDLDETLWLSQIHGKLQGMQRHLRIIFLLTDQGLEDPGSDRPAVLFFGLCPS